MKNVLLKIVGTQIGVDDETEQLEFITEGKMYQKNGATYIVYEESELSGMEGCKTTVRMSGKSVKMHRFGKGVSTAARLEFEEGKRYESYYHTPYGPIEIEILTNELNNNLSFEEGGSLDIDYNVCLKGLSEGRNRINIQIM